MWSAAKVSDVAHRSAALRRPATTDAGTTESVINGQLFSCPDFPEAIKEDLPAVSADRKIRIATMIDELGAASSHRSIEH